MNESVFWGLLNYCVKLLPDASAILVPFCTLLAKGVELFRGKEHQTAFEADKRAIQNGKHLIHLDPNKALRVVCGASFVVLGAVLSHVRRH